MSASRFLQIYVPFSTENLTARESAEFERLCLLCGVRVMEGELHAEMDIPHRTDEASTFDSLRKEYSESARRYEKALMDLEFYRSKLRVERKDD